MRLRTMTLSRLGASVCAIALMLGFGRGLVADTVYANNPAPGDLVVGTPNPGATVAIGSSGWLYNNVRTGATIGIRTDNPFLGNGSVVLSSTGSGGKADVEMFPAAPLGQLKDLTAFSYSWYRDSSSTVAGHLAPSLRLYISNGAQSGYFVWEPTYNGYGTVATDTWVTSDAFNSGNGVFWTTGSLPNAFNKYVSFNEWVNTNGLANYNVLGISAGIGSGWSGTYLGALDGITVGFNNATPTTYNFEVVPEPSSIAMSILAGGIGLLEIARRRLRRAV